MGRAGGDRERHDRSRPAIATDRRFFAGIEGFGEILRALVEADRMSAEQAALAQIALTSLAKAGADGQPQINTSFTLQDGKMYLGPARLGEAPRIVWKSAFGKSARPPAGDHE